MAAGDALHPEQFRMQTNIGPKPGSQGTLFQGGHPAQPWPRGYSPERMHEVVSATVHSGLDPSKTHPSRARETAAVRDTVARSTVPVEHLRDVGWYPHSEVSESREIGGYYSSDRNRVGRSQIHIAPTYGAEHTPIHEIGHHVSNTVEKTEHSAYNTPAHRGTEEGYAENYAETHFRDRRGKQQRSTLTSLGWAGYEKSEGARVEMSRAFADKRKESPLAKREKPFDANNMTKKQQGLPPEHITGQMALLDKHGGGEYTQHPETGEWQPKPGSRDWDYTYEDRTRGLKRERG